MTNEAAQAGERDLSGDFVEHSHPQYGGGYFCTPDVFERVVALASLPAVQPAESGAIASKLAHHLQQAHTFVENTEAFGSPASHGIIQAGNDVACAWNIDESKAALADFAALSQPATTEAGDGVLNKAQVCAALANAGVMLVKTEHGLRVEKAITGATAYSVSATPVAAVAQPVADEGASRFKSAMRVLTSFACNRYLMSCAHGRWDGAEKALRHEELCRFYLCAVFDIADADKARHEREAEYAAIHQATQELTDCLDEEIGFPTESQPDYDSLVPLFFEKFHTLAMTALAASPSCEQSAGSGCKGINCGTKTGDHSPECIAQHEAAYSSGNALDTPGNREPECRYMGYKGRPLGDGATDDQKAAWEEGRRAAIQPSERQDVGGDRG